MPHRTNFALGMISVVPLALKPFAFLWFSRNEFRGYKMGRAYGTPHKTLQWLLAQTKSAMGTIGFVTMGFNPWGGRPPDHV